MCVYLKGWGEGRRGGNVVEAGGGEEGGGV